MAGINIGEFEEIVDLYECITTMDQRGSKVEQYDWCCRHMAKVEVGASESDADYNVFSANSVTITTFKMCNVTTRWRVRWRNVMYNIRSVDPGERISPFMRLTAEEVMR